MFTGIEKRQGIRIQKQKTKISLVQLERAVCYPYLSESTVGCHLVKRRLGCCRAEGGQGHQLLTARASSSFTSEAGESDSLRLFVFRPTGGGEAGGTEPESGEKKEKKRAHTRSIKEQHEEE